MPNCSNCGALRRVLNILDPKTAQEFLAQVTHQFSVEATERLRAKEISRATCPDCKRAYVIAVSKEGILVTWLPITPSIDEIREALRWKKELLGDDEELPDTIPLKKAA